jgi:hypothetical protein
MSRRRNGTIADSKPEMTICRSNHGRIPSGQRQFTDGFGREFIGDSLEFI